MTGGPGAGAAGEQPAAPAALMERHQAARVWVYARLMEAIAQAVAAHAADFLQGTRDDGSPVMGVGDRETAHARGRQLGAVQRKAGKVRAVLDGDDPAFVAWVKAHPKLAHNVIVREEVSPALVESLKKGAARRRAPVTADGEVIPGMRVEVGEPFLAKTLDPLLLAEVLDPARLAVLVESIAQGLVGVPGIPALDQGSE